MGLLDEAIREHLELKRRHGADPGEIAREESAALPTAEAVGEELEVADAAAEPLPEGQELGGVGQETAELDMTSVLGAAESPHPESAAPTPPVVGHDGGAEVWPEWDGLDDDAGGEGEQPERIPGQERLTFE